MPLIRGTHALDDHFTQIPNSWLRDARISLAAKGLLAQLMSHRPGWKITVESIAVANGVGVDLIRTAINQLLEAGYLHRSDERERNTRGHVGGYVYTTQDPVSEPASDYPRQGEPRQAQPRQDNPTHKNNSIKEQQIKEQQVKTLAHAEREREFETFWSLYPRKVGKGAALKAFIKARADTPWMAVYDGVIRLDADPHKPETRFIPHPATWLAQGRWMDAPYPAPRISREEQNRRNLEDYGTNE